MAVSLRMMSTLAPFPEATVPPEWLVVHSRHFGRRQPPHLRKWPQAIFGAEAKLIGRKRANK